MKRSRRVIFTGLGAVLSLSLCYSAGADIYKWVDEEGNVVYSQQPPVDKEAETIKAPASIRSEEALQNLRDLKINNAKVDEKRKKQLEEKKQAVEESRVNEENCKKGEAMLASFSTRPTVQLVQEDGSRVRATEAERQQRIAEARAIIKEFCKE
ncbi:MAG: hypothetical protein A3I78_00890 [Gammaproteobacteria bacterium RIFCSPLOWO2_02_FULL_56_15]|nr:MAG: hypothetical protein A3I78_00890 [Gammaproteobacteria bacterium RIFCSPLOWO2_02_FULL_56_15]